MDFVKIIADLRAERARLDEAIANLEELTVIRERKSGRPPRRVAAVGNRRAPSVKSENNGFYPDPRRREGTGP
jgi:hypothetical protein